MIRIEITLGLLATIATVFLIALYGTREDERMSTRARAYDVRSVERGAEMYEQYCASCHGPNAVGGMCPPLNEYSGLVGGTRGPGIAWRMEELGLDRTAAYEYVYSAIDAGRTVSSRPWRWVGNRSAGNEGVMAMPAWGQNNGGPLRPDQMKDIANFIVGFDDFVPTDFAEAEAWLAEIQADPNIEMVSVYDEPGAQAEPPSEDDPIAYGEYLFGTKACNTCHAYEPAGSVANACPPLDGVLAIAAERVADEDYDGAADSALAYLRESMLDPGAYIVPEYRESGSSIMPNLALTESETDSLIAFLTGELPEGFEAAEEPEDEEEATESEEDDAASEDEDAASEDEASEDTEEDASDEDEEADEESDGDEEEAEDEDEE